jgi:hypothetical protein
MKNNMTVIRHPPYFSPFPIEDKTERPHIDTKQCKHVEENYFEDDGGR